MLSSAFYSVLIECQGGFPERFLNFADEQHISLWDVRRQDTSLWCRAAAVDYVRLRPVARRACVRMRVRKKQGLVFHVRRWGLRVGTLVGMVLFCVLLNLLSSRIWVLRVRGNETVTDDAILTALKPLGVYEGAEFSKVDFADLRLTALQQLPDLIWLTVNQTGSIVTVEVQERTPTPPLSDTDPVNLVAVCDGVILRVDTVSGQAVVKVGDAVTRGDLLISGVTDSKVGPQLKHATGSVLARTSHTLRCSVPLRDTVSTVDRVIARPMLSVFGWDIPLYTGGTLTGEPIVSTERHPVVAAGVPLPIGITTTRYTYMKTISITRTEQRARELAEIGLAKKEAELYQTFTAETRTVYTEKTADSITVTATYAGTQELTTERPIGR